MNNQQKYGEFVLPQQFGAIGDGIADDTDALERAIAEATEKRIALKLPAGEYKTLRTLELDHIDVHCEDAKISFWGLAQSEPAIYVWDHVNLYGKLQIWTVDNNLQNHGGRCGIGFGNYDSGAGAHHSYVEEVEISGGGYNLNGTLITGDSSDITIDKITVHGGNHLGRAVLIHWGNAAEHHPKYVDGVDTHQYVREENCGYTKHPHDIHIGRIIGDHFCDQVGDACVLYLSAVYNITIDEIIADYTRHVLMMTGGDGGFEFATPEESAHGSKNVIIKKITATNVQHSGLYYMVESSYQDIPPFWGELALGEVTITYPESHTGLGPYFNGIGRLSIDRITLKNIKRPTFYFVNACTDVRIGTLTLEDCNASELFRVETHGKCLNTGIGIDGLTVENLILKNSAYQRIFSLGKEAKNVHLEKLTLVNSFVSEAIFHARETVPAENQITIGEDARGVTLQSGQSCTVTERAEKG